MEIVFLLFLFIVGAGMGSFVCCQAQRQRLLFMKKRKLGKRSVCLKCGYQLKWYDNVPIFSWIMLRGKCRKCGKKIGGVEIISEILMGLAFLFVGVYFSDFWRFSGVDWAYFCSIMVFVVILGYLAIYDGKWGGLPVLGLTFSVICAIISLILKDWRLFLSTQSFQIVLDSLPSTIIGVGILAGTYFLLYFISREKFVGGGDWILGLALAIALGDWWLALLALTISNVLAAIVMVPVARKRKKAKIYFGPWMILGFFIVFVLQDFFLGFLAF